MEEAAAVAMDYITSECLCERRLGMYSHLMQRLTTYLLRCSISSLRSNTKRLSPKVRTFNSLSTYILTTSSRTLAGDLERVLQVYPALLAQWRYPLNHQGRTNTPEDRPELRGGRPARSGEA